MYQNPGVAAPQQQAVAQPDNRTLIIERVIQNGQVTQENKRYLNPGEPIPAPPAQMQQATPAPQQQAQPTAPETPATSPQPTGDSTRRWQPVPMKPIPVGRSSEQGARLSASIQQISGSDFYR
jgi:hypothetical protein